VTHAHDEPTPDQPVEQVDASDVVADVDSEQQLGADAAAARPADEPGDEVTDEPTAEPPADTTAEPAAGDSPGVTAVETQLAERTADLQRLQAEFLNYKRRVDRDRDLIRENATYAVLAPITEVLDTIDRAREHGPLDDGLKTVAEQLERVVAGLGLTKFGAPGDAFDPTIHEALSHIGEDPEVTVTTCKVIAKSGYKIGDRVLRAAQVLVVDPGASSQESQE
jgi:molecular chaperone GrpE